MVSLDWLTVNGRCKPSTFPASPSHETTAWGRADLWAERIGLCLVPSDNRTAHFARIAYLCDRGGEKLATIVADPHSAALFPPDYAQVQFSNVTLYTDANDGTGRPLWLALWTLIERAGFTYTGLSRVDLAADALADDGGGFVDVVSSCVMGNAGRYYGASGWTPRFQRSKVVAFEMGARRSNKFLRCYCKSRELRAAGRGKRHIVDAWFHRLGFDPTELGREVNRFELQVKGKELRRYFPEEGAPGYLHRLADAQHRVEALASMAVGMFDFRTWAERAREAVPLCRWDWTGAAAPFVPAKRERRTLTLNERVLKMTLRTLYLHHLATGARESRDNVREMVSDAGPAFAAWYGRAKERWRKESCSLLNAARDGENVGLFDRLSIAFGGACEMDADICAESGRNDANAPARHIRDPNR